MYICIYVYMYIPVYNCFCMYSNVSNLYVSFHAFHKFWMEAFMASIQTKLDN